MEVDYLGDTGGITTLKLLGWDIKNKLPEGRKSSRLRNDQLALSLT